MTERDASGRFIVEDMPTILAKVKAHAEAHYNDGGWDVIVECWDAADLTRDFEESGVKTFDDALASLSSIVGIYADRQADARNSAF